MAFGGATTLPPLWAQAPLKRAPIRISFQRFNEVYCIRWIDPQSKVAHGGLRLRDSRRPPAEPTPRSSGTSSLAQGPKSPGAGRRDARMMLRVHAALGSAVSREL